MDKSNGNSAITVEADTAASVSEKNLVYKFMSSLNVSDWMVLYVRMNVIDALTMQCILFFAFRYLATLFDNFIFSAC